MKSTVDSKTTSSAVSDALEPRAEKFRERSEEYIWRRTHDWIASITTTDTSVVRTILADDFKWHTAGGKTLGKADAVAEADTFPGEWRAVGVDYMSVKATGETASSEGSLTWEKINGETGSLGFTGNWEYKDGKWLVKEWWSRAQSMLK